MSDAGESDIRDKNLTRRDTEQRCERRLFTPSTPAEPGTLQRSSGSAPDQAPPCTSNAGTRSPRTSPRSPEPRPDPGRSYRSAGPTSPSLETVSPASPNAEPRGSPGTCRGSPHCTRHWTPLDPGADNADPSAASRTSAMLSLLRLGTARQTDGSTRPPTSPRSTPARTPKPNCVRSSGSHRSAPAAMPRPTSTAHPCEPDRLRPRPLALPSPATYGSLRMRSN